MAGLAFNSESYWVSPSMMLVRIVNETLSVARVQSRVGGSFFMDMRKTDSSVGEDGPQPVSSKIITANQKEKNCGAWFSLENGGVFEILR